MTDKKLKKVEAVLRASIEAALERGDLVRRHSEPFLGTYDSYSICDSAVKEGYLKSRGFRDEYYTTCLLGTFSKDGYISDFRGHAADKLGLGINEAHAIEQGFEHGGIISLETYYDKSSALKRYFRLGYRLYKDYVKTA